MPTKRKCPGWDYPQGILTNAFVPEYVPMADDKFNEIMARDDTARNKIASLFAEREETPSSRKKKAAIVMALAEHLGVRQSPASDHFWHELAWALMWRHVPAFRPRGKAGAPEKDPYEHFVWLRLAARECARRDIAKPDNRVFRRISETIYPKIQGSEKAKRDEESKRFEIVKGNFRRARKWFVGLSPQTRAEIEKDIRALK